MSPIQLLIIDMRTIAITIFVAAVTTCVGQRKAIAPDFLVIQYAGSIGYLSGGTGYDIFHNRGRVSLHFGSVPKAQGGPLNILTGKFFVEPWTLRLARRTTLNPLDIGLMLSYHMGDDFKINVPDYFASDNYYWWHTAMRAHLATETSISIQMEPNRFLRKLTGYAELNSNDLYLVSFASNASTLALHDIFKIGIGVRLTF